VTSFRDDLLPLPLSKSTGRGVYTGSGCAVHV
jgi:hypothetical protein